jgi:integrase
MARRARGDGSVYYDAARSCWVGAVDLGRDPETGRRVRRKVSAPTKTGCRELLDGLRDERRRTGTVGRRDVTVEAVVRDLLAMPPASWKSPNTIEANADHAERIIAAIGRVRLANLAVGQVEGMLRKMAADGYARKTIATTRGLLIVALRRAERNGVATRNVAVLAEMPAARVRLSRAMTPQQVRALLALDLTAWWRAYITVGVMLGLRPGELAGLQWENVDLDAGVMRVRQSLKRVTGPGPARLEYGGLKTQQSKRALRMPAPVRSALAALRREQAAGRLRLGAGYTGSGALVFAGPAGQPRWPQAIRGEFRALCAGAAIGMWQLRELRHTFVSQMSAAGVDVEVIADHVGHINSNITRAVYRHQLRDEVGEAAAVFDSLYGATS